MAVAQGQELGRQGSPGISSGKDLRHRVAPLEAWAAPLRGESSELKGPRVRLSFLCSVSQQSGSDAKKGGKLLELDTSSAGDIFIPASLERAQSSIFNLTRIP